MRTIAAPLLAHYQSQVQTFSFCVSLSLSSRQPRVTFISQNEQAEVTTMWPHRLKTGDVVKFVDIEGMTQINYTTANELFGYATVNGPATFTVNIDTTGFAAFRKGTNYGTARRVMGFTEFERDLYFNGLRLHAKTGARQTAVDRSSDFSFAVRDVQCLLNSEQIVDRDIEEGYYSGFEYETFEMDYQGGNVLQSSLKLPTAIVNSAAEGEVAWSNPTNALTSNDVYATVALTNQTSQLLNATGFGFTLPANAIIRGIKVEVEAKTNSGINSLRLKLIKNGVVLPTDRSVTVSTVEAFAPAGADSDMWGAVWNATQVNASNFGVSIQEDGATTITYSVDAIRITVYYTISERHVLEYGRAGDIKWGDVAFTAEGHGILSLLGQNFGPLCSILCRAQLGNRITSDWDERFGCKVRLNPPEWLTATAYAAIAIHDAGLGSVVKPSVYNGRYYKCITAGTSGVSEPVWPTTIASTINDGGVTWSCIDSWVKEGTVTSFVDRRNFTDSSRTEPATWFRYGLLTFLTGQNAGFSTEVKKFSSGGVYELRDKCFRNIEVDAKYIVEVGCDKRRTTCVSKFDNIYNFRGEPDIPGVHQQFLYPDTPE